RYFKTEGFGVAGGRFFYRSAEDDIWAVAPASTGPIKVKTFIPMTSAFELHFGDRLPGLNSFGDLNGTLLFGVLDDFMDHQLWRSDGTAAGTWQVADVSPSPYSAPDNFLAVNGRMVFRTGELFVATDGTPPGTLLLPPTEVVEPVRLGDQAFFIAADFEKPGLWRTDGTTVGTVRVAEVPRANLVFPPQLTVSGGKLFFRTQNPWDLRVSDGTGAGTLRLETAGYGPAGLTDGGSALFFHSSTPETGYELWKTDGTLAGTVLIKDIRPGSEGAMDSDFAYFQRYASLPGGGVVFAADDGEAGLELWKSNGSVAGTVRLLDILPGAAGSEPRHLTRVGNRIFFVANDGVHGWELWVTAGTPASTRMIKDIAPGLASSLPNDLEVIGDVLVFSAFDGAHGIEAWRSDGTALGTRRLQDIAPGPASSSPQQFTLSGDKVFFAANDNVTGFELWAMPASALLSTFADVSFGYWAWTSIEAIAQAGITRGCGEGRYCPVSQVTRAEMAIFLERAIHGGTFTPPPATGTVFTDVPTSYWAAAWIEQFAADGITTGCAPSEFCPDALVNRAEMAVFLLRSKHGAAYTPPPATGTRFTDVPASYWAAAWIEQLAAEGITTGCAANQYCPGNSVSRDQMAAFLTRTFNLPTP
ncbi:MAG TPA: ELWxxDGT repeat protein, partial [Thermoanaerobaculia bacterium]